MILITGGLGYIGSHFVAALMEKNIPCIIVDDLSHTQYGVLDSLRELFPKADIDFNQINYGDVSSLSAILQIRNITTLVHFGAFKSVEESMTEPFKYYENNFTKSTLLIKTCIEYGIRNIIFSSTAAIYGNKHPAPFDELSPVDPISPYAKSKYFLEAYLQDITAVRQDLRVFCLRYFNPVGSHRSYIIGEDYLSPKNNTLFASLIKSVHYNKNFQVFGADYDTLDGSCIRDFIHIDDLIDAHITALDYTQQQIKSSFYEVVNIGTGKGFSILQTIDCMKSNNIHVPYIVQSPRPGDVAISIAATDKARVLWGWVAKRNLDDMCQNAYHRYKLALIK